MSWGWRGHGGPPRAEARRGRGPPRKSPSRRPTGGEGPAQRARFELRKWKRAPRGETIGGAWGGSAIAECHSEYNRTEN